MSSNPPRCWSPHNGGPEHWDPAGCWSWPARPQLNGTHLRRLWARRSNMEKPEKCWNLIQQGLKISRKQTKNLQNPVKWCLVLVEMALQALLPNLLPRNTYPASAIAPHHQVGSFPEGVHMGASWAGHLINRQFLWSNPLKIHEKLHLLNKLTSLVHTFCTLTPHPISPKMSRKIQPSTSVVSWIHSSETQTATTWLPSRGRTRSKLKRVETFEKRTRSQLPPSSRYGHVGNKMHQNALFSLEFGVYIYIHIHMCMYVYIYITIIHPVYPHCIPIFHPHF